MASGSRRESQIKAEIEKVVRLVDAKKAGRLIPAVPCSARCGGGWGMIECSPLGLVIQKLL